ncbi:hypothetical protein VPH35_051498 [Triticum aestivum]
MEFHLQAFDPNGYILIKLFLVCKMNIVYVKTQDSREARVHRSGSCSTKDGQRVLQGAREIHGRRDYVARHRAHRTQSVTYGLPGENSRPKQGPRGSGQHV